MSIIWQQIIFCIGKPAGPWYDLLLSDKGSHSRRMGQWEPGFGKAEGARTAVPERVSCMTVHSRRCRKPFSRGILRSALGGKTKHHIILMDYGKIFTT